MTQQAFLFPGQGSQAPGMGKALAESSASARQVFEEVDDALSLRLSAIIWGDDETLLTRTDNAQPAIMATSIAVWRELQRQGGDAVRQAMAFAAGHSLGEYSALCAAGTLTLADTARLLQERGSAMQKAMPDGGSMAAILGLEFDALAKLVDAHGSGQCVIANDNAPGQIVISGLTGAVTAVMEAARAAGAKRALPLNVSAPFHSPYMQPAAERMREALAGTALQTPVCPVVANVTAAPEQQPDALRGLLVEQVTGRVRWRESMLFLQQQQLTGVTECGHGAVLSGMARRVDKSWQTSCLHTPGDIDAWLEQTLRRAA